ncbi:hypothetical protein ADEAN_000477000 [Angomonas deanei]|uniref:Uncharacterized protein n=1 Tax=Angomonas deanei TaxID=59799 RepID=A0A7G2CGH3_9TRYP|nr:hypothetical protein ADEAN_000477000 [Angomonas deanei]
MSCASQLIAKAAELQPRCPHRSPTCAKTIVSCQQISSVYMGACDAQHAYDETNINCDDNYNCVCLSGVLKCTPCGDNDGSGWVGVDFTLLGLCTLIALFF